MCSYLLWIFLETTELKMREGNIVDVKTLVVVLYASRRRWRFSPLFIYHPTQYDINWNQLLFFFKIQLLVIWIVIIKSQRAESYHSNITFPCCSACFYDFLVDLIPNDVFVYVQFQTLEQPDFGDHYDKSHLRWTTKTIKILLFINKWQKMINN